VWYHILSASSVSDGTHCSCFVSDPDLRSSGATKRIADGTFLGSMRNGTCSTREGRIDGKENVRNTELNV